METLWKKTEPIAWERLQAFKEGRTGYPWIVRSPLSNTICAKLILLNFEFV